MAGITFRLGYEIDNPCVWVSQMKLDESTAPQHLKSPQSLSVRSLHLTLVTKWSRSWSWMSYSHSPLFHANWPSHSEIQHLKIWPWKSLVKDMRAVKGQVHIQPWKFKGHGKGQTQWSHLRPWVQSICLLFVLWQLHHFWLRYSKFHIWPWKFKVKVMTKIDQNLIR